MGGYQHGEAQIRKNHCRRFYWMRPEHHVFQLALPIWHLFLQNKGLKFKLFDSEPIAILILTRHKNANSQRAAGQCPWQRTYEVSLWLERGKVLEWIYSQLPLHLTWVGCLMGWMVEGTALPLWRRRHSLAGPKVKMGIRCVPCVTGCHPSQNKFVWPLGKCWSPLRGCLFLGKHKLFLFKWATPSLWGQNPSP